MRFIRLTMEYDGKNFCGWQRQKNAVSVQQTLEEALFRITQELTKTRASGRTDAKVHAQGQVVSFSTNTKLSCEVLMRALNGVLPKDVAIKELVEVGPDFDARFSATKKTYRYQIYTGIRSPLREEKFWQLPYQLNIEAMKHASQYLLGEHDFKSFQAADCDRVNTVRHLTDIEITQTDFLHGAQVVIKVSGNAFLKNMVRILVGTLVQVGRGVYAPEYVQAILEKKDRTFAGRTAPPHGLFLESVEYARNSSGMLQRPLKSIAQ